MKKQLIIYCVTTVIFFFLIILARRWFAPIYVTFLLGGALGAILPDVDHFIYIYFLKPHELTSQRATSLMAKGKFLATYDLLARTRSERTNLVFHTLLFQLIFAALTFFVVSSSNSLFGRGLVLAFSLHLLVDQYLDFRQIGNISHWMKNLNISLDRDKTVFLWVGLGILLVFYGFIF